MQLTGKVLSRYSNKIESVDGPYFTTRISTFEYILGDDQTFPQFIYTKLFTGWQHKAMLPPGTVNVATSCYCYHTEMHVDSLT